MRYIFTSFLILINTVILQGQSRFFHMTEDWQTHTIQEYDTHYVAIGNGIVPPDYIDFIRFTNIDKLGNFVSSWNYQLNGMLFTQIREQQSMHNRRIGFTSKPPSNSGNRGGRIQLNEDLTEVIDYEWEYIPPPPSENSIMFITHQDSPNKIIQALNYYDTEDDKIKAVMVATDSMGNTNWEFIFPCEGDYCRMWPRHVLPAHDGGYLLTSHEEHDRWQNSRHTISTIIKVNSLGEEQWRIYAGGVGESYSSEEILLVPTDDGNYLCAWTDKNAFNGFSYQTNPEATIWFAKINEDGEKLWEKNIQEDIDIWEVGNVRYVLSQMIRLSDNNLALIGYGSFGNIIVKLTQNADVLWARDILPLELQPPGSEEAYASFYGVTETSDGGFACTGEAYIFPGDAFPQTTQVGFVLKLDEYGCLEEGCHLDDPVVSVEDAVEEISNLSIYPNPATHNITINYHLPHTPNQLTLSIHNIASKAVHTQPLPTHEGSVRIALDKNLPAGTYFCHLVADGQIIGVERFTLIR